MDSGRGRLLHMLAFDISDECWPVTRQKLLEPLDGQESGKKAPVGVDSIKRLRHRWRSRFFYRDQ
eukprot:10158508-Prorocentrum_lima.AAC.1